MTSNTHGFQRRCSIFQQQRLREHTKVNAWSGPPSDTIYGGITVTFSNDSVSNIAIAIRDTTYLLDFLERHFPPEGSRPTPSSIVDFVISELKAYGGRHFEKFIGVAMPIELSERCPALCSRLWKELDIVPVVLHESEKSSRDSNETPWKVKSVDELADSMAQKCIRYFGPNNTPLVQVGIRGLVEVDAAFHIRLANLQDYQKTVAPATWAAVNHYASDLKKGNVKIAFFSATPQGGGVALMRHALVRFSRVLGTDIKWYVPNPRPGVFRITKTNHNILQGVSNPEDRLTPENRQVMLEWIRENANRYWSCNGGPLTSPSEGGADIVIIDDPQMPGLIPLAKKAAPERPVIFRSHIQIRSDLTSIPNTPQAEAWGWLWESIQLADIFISHPISAFVPHNVPQEMVGYLPASIGWLDGLNKTMNDWDIAFYGRVFNAACRNNSMPTIDHPEDVYIAQIARFDPSKGIFDVLDSYAKFRKRLTEHAPKCRPPKLLICGHGSADDPDGSLVFDAVIDYIGTRLPQLVDSICVMRLNPSDQILNALLSKCRVALQLSSEEGFEVKISEALHKGKPVIATMAGGIPLQVKDKENGFLVDVGDTDSVCQHLYDLWTDEERYNLMSNSAPNTVSDEVNTVGNAMCWLYLAWKLIHNRNCKPNGRWIIDMAREEANRPYQEDENRLKRAVVVKYMK